MQARRIRFRYSLVSLLALVLGVAIGYTLNMRTLRILVGLAANEAYLSSLPAYRIAPSDVLEVELADGRWGAASPVAGRYIVLTDGNVDLREFGQVAVAGKTIAEAREDVQTAVARLAGTVRVDMNVVQFNSLAYYIIVRDGNAHDQVTRVRITGNETVLDGIA